MNKKERVLAALENREADHVPGAFWFHFPQEQALGQACVDAHLKSYRDTIRIYQNNIATVISDIPMKHWKKWRMCRSFMI